MKLLSLIFSFFITINPSIFIKGKDFSGYIFEENHFVLMSIDNQDKRYTPTKEDIFLAEEIIKKDIFCVNKKLINQLKGYPQIHKKLKNYVRQYVGFLNKSNEKVIWINFIWKNRFTDKEYSNDIINVHDGGSYYWSIQINLTTKSASNLKVNGIG
ncbi:hypothetical protein B0A78_13545 [Flavobacterium columnare NBRC 100251 = ATCC 23463]|nr:MULTISPECIES: hypothetical protein [Flavobacterium]MCJ1805870.1 hypothetical protein [Flavobacterium covae]PDS21839.1 hypothetical protein B0A78_13545 [Flavobacterium columnare NBRC 100251 = ATCC 23463]GEM59277.1 hypothetical protein FC1_25150 [Flavobacterium columnare NBRC 100251 = ATCC 23463]